MRQARLVLTCPTFLGTNNDSFTPSQEANQQAQAAALKASAKERGLPVPQVLEYLEHTNMQVSCARQRAFYDAANSGLWLRLQSHGLVDCPKDHGDWQGPALYQIDYRQQAARDFFIDNALIDTLLSFGAFLDVVDMWFAGTGPGNPGFLDLWDATRTRGFVESPRRHIRQVRGGWQGGIRVW